jgi:hypothetical protein
MKPEKVMCDCGHLESDHSDFTRGYSIDQKGRTYCYECSLADDIAYLKETGKLTAYLSSDGKRITTWPGLIIATVTSSHVVNFGYCRDQMSFDAVMADGTRLYGRGPGNGMYCRLRVRRAKK